MTNEEKEILIASVLDVDIWLSYQQIRHKINKAISIVGIANIVDKMRNKGHVQTDIEQYGNNPWQERTLVRFA